MARTIKDTSLDKREARSRLVARGKPYYRLIEEGLHLGYRKPKGVAGRPAGAGKWVARQYVDDGVSKEGKRQPYKVEIIGPADDFSDADGVAILNFKQAQDKARERMKRRAQVAAGNSGPYTVNDAIKAYLTWLENEGRSAAAIRDAESRADAFIRPKLGDKEVGALTAKDLQHWRDNVAKALPRVRTKPGKKQKHRSLAEDANVEEREEEQRKRRASANRIWTTLRAALNKAFEDDEVSSDGAWRKVKPFKDVDKARTRYLKVAEAQQLANAIEAEFRPMVQGALLTGGRYGQLARLTVADFNGDAGTVRMTSRKGDGTKKVYHVHLTDEGVSFFNQMCLGRNDAKGLIFKKTDGTAWLKSEQARPMKEASSRAKISPPVNFHCLRHTYASHAVMNGAPLLVVAQNLGHSDTRMVEQHYAHLAPGYVADAIRAAVPRFGFKAAANVKQFRPAR
jgi:integrase